MRTLTTRFALILTAGSVLAGISAAQQTPPAGGAPAPGPGRGGGFSQPAPSDWNNHEGWNQIFDGSTLNGWNCDPEIWSVVDGSITAKSTPEKPTGTTYCTWMGGEPADFELKAEFRMLVGGNSGIQYRSRAMPARGGGGGGGGFGGGRGGRGGDANQAAAAPAPPATALLNVQPCQMQIPVMFPPPAGRGGGGGAGRGGRGGDPAAAGRGGAPGGAAPGGGRGGSGLNIGGYQYDFDFTGNYPGNLYENGVPANAPEGTTNRGIITYKGQVVHLLPEAKRETVGCLGDASDLKGVMNVNGWNYFHIIARGPVLIHMLNGRLITLTIDDDPARRKLSGRIAVQIEGMGEVFFKNLWLKSW